LDGYLKKTVDLLEPRDIHPHRNTVPDPNIPSDSQLDKESFKTAAEKYDHVTPRLYLGR
jgi:hypothetical protein